MSHNNVIDIKIELKPTDNTMYAFIHCELCMKELPHGTSPRDWLELEVGFTEVGIQVWCKRHDCNVIHINFEGISHPAVTTRNA